MKIYKITEASNYIGVSIKYYSARGGRKKKIIQEIPSVESDGI